MNIKETVLQEPSIFLFRKMWTFAKDMHRRIVLYASLFLVANIIILLPPLIFGSIVREIQFEGVSAENLNHILLLLGFLFLTEVGFWIFHGSARVIENNVAYHVGINYREYLLKGVLRLGLTWHNEHDSGNTIDRVNKAGDGIEKFSSNVFQIIQLIVKLVGTSLVLIWFSPSIAFWVFVFVLGSFVIIFNFDRYLVPQYRRLNEFSNKVMAGVFDALSNITTIKILHIEKPIHEGVVTRMLASKNLYQKNSKLTEWKWGVGGIIFQGIAVVPIAFYLYTNVQIEQPVDVGTISALFLYLSNLIYVYFGFTGFYQELLIYKNQVLNAGPIETAFSTHIVLERNKGSSWKMLSLRDLNFTYDEDHALPHLNGIDMDVHRGERIAVIGESGSGKTTFLKVLHGLYPEAKAMVNFDREKKFLTSFCDIDLKTMLVPQEPEVFSSTIRENITLGIPYTEREVHHVMRIANFEEVVESLPKGLDSVVNEKGVNLSGGQKQRLALSRALLFTQDKDIILLDESTSSVDPENEEQIYTNIWSAFLGKTVIASIHKMNLLKLFDRIYIFDQGSIVDTGTFDELLKWNKEFRQAWREFVATHKT